MTTTGTPVDARAGRFCTYETSRKTKVAKRIVFVEAVWSSMEGERTQGGKRGIAVEFTSLLCALCYRPAFEHDNTTGRAIRQIAAT